jgi:hypothetical protein
MLIAKFTLSGEQFRIDVVEGIEEGNDHFVLKSTEKPEITLKVKYPLEIHKNYEPQNFKCHPFFSDAFFKESDIYQVYEKSIADRVGWIFPVQSLASKEHDKSQNEHFLRYAYVSFLILLKGDFFDKDYLFDINEVDQELSITDIYPSDLIIASFSNIKTNLIASFNVKNYYHSFYDNYYYCCSSKSQLNKLPTKAIIKQGDPSVWIERISQFLETDVFINQLFTKYLIEDNHPLVHFSFLYQIIELLINKILDLELIPVFAAIQAQSKRPYEAKRDFDVVTPEDKRISLLFSKYSIPPITHPEFIHSCDKLLSKLNKTPNTLNGYVYQVRNSVVHNFRDVIANDNDLSILSEINEEFDSLVCRVLSNYQEPVAAAV